MRPGYTFVCPRLARHAGEQESESDCRVADSYTSGEPSDAADLYAGVTKVLSFMGIDEVDVARGIAAIE